MEASKGKAFFLLTVTFFFWGSIYVAGKLIIGDVPAQLLSGLRCMVAMLPLWLMARKHSGVKIEREDRKYFLLVGGLGYFLTISLVQLGISLTGASMASLINAMTPVVVTVAAAVLLKEKITPVTCICLIMALLGTVIVTKGASGQSDMLGITAVLLSVFSWGFASVYMRRLTAKYPPALVTAYGMATSLLFHIPASIATVVTQPVSISMTSAVVILYLGLIGSGLSQYTWTRCLSVLPAGTCSLFYPLQPVFSAVLGALILKETFHSTFFWGLLLISADVALVTWDNARKSRPTA